MPGGTTRERWVNVGEANVGSVNVNNVTVIDVAHVGSELKSSAEDDMFEATHAQTYGLGTTITIQTHDLTAAEAIAAAYWKTGLATSFGAKVYKGKNAGDAADKTLAVPNGAFVITGVEGVGGQHNQYTQPTIRGFVLANATGDDDSYSVT